MSQTYRFKVRAEFSSLRIDQSISAHLPKISRTQARKILGLGGVFVDRKRVKIAGKLVYEAQSVEVNVAEGLTLTDVQSATQDIFIPIVAKTEEYIVVDKPSGVFSAPTRQCDQNDLLTFLARQLGPPEEKQQQLSSLFLVHRLDRPTSGLMVIARTKAAAASLGNQIVAQSMKRMYLAALVGELKESISVEQPIREKEAKTQFIPVATKTMEPECTMTLVEARLFTGRTHQVRAHAEAIGMAVAGDSKYGRAKQRALKERPPRLALHAFSLSFIEPESGEKRDFHSPWPQDLSKWWDQASQASTSS